MWRTQAFESRCLISRPGLLVGPHDPTGRLSWWVQRLQRGGPVLAPGGHETPVQFIDARDAAAWMLLQAERATTGVFNLLPRAQAGLHQVDITRALASGLQCRPLAHTLQDTAQWLAMAPPPVAAPGCPARPAVGLSADREAALLAGWQTGCQTGCQAGCQTGSQAGSQAG